MRVLSFAIIVFMQLVYGLYLFPVNGTKIGSSTETIFNEANVPYKVRQSLKVSGYLSVNGQADAVLQESALRTALAFPYQDVKFLQDDGAPTPLSLVNFGSLTGVRVKNLNFPNTDGPEYVTIRSFECEFEAEYGLPLGKVGPAAGLLSFTETLSFEGGGPIFRHRLAIGNRKRDSVFFRFYGSQMYAVPFLLFQMYAVPFLLFLFRVVASGTLGTQASAV